jgi:pSer/pThr/pTyr-binding forkhead associated (FHA) protein
MSTKTLAIKVFHGDQLVDTQTLSQDVIKIGKLKSSHVCLDDETVARMHAVIEVSGDEVRVIDLGSATGTTVNGARIDKNAVIADGDVLTFGPVPPRGRLRPPSPRARRRGRGRADPRADARAAP